MVDIWLEKLTFESQIRFVKHFTKLLTTNNISVVVENYFLPSVAGFVQMIWIPPAYLAIFIACYQICSSIWTIALYHCPQMIRDTDELISLMLINSTWETTSYKQEATAASGHKLWFSKSMSTHCSSSCSSSLSWSVCWWWCARLAQVPVQVSSGGQETGGHGVRQLRPPHTPLSHSAQSVKDFPINCAQRSGEIKIILRRDFCVISDNNLENISWKLLTTVTLLMICSEGRGARYPMISVIQWLTTWLWWSLRRCNTGCLLLGTTDMNHLQQVRYYLRSF